MSYPPYGGPPYQAPPYGQPQPAFQQAPYQQPPYSQPPAYSQPPQQYGPPTGAPPPYGYQPAPQGYPPPQQPAQQDVSARLAQFYDTAAADGVVDSTEVMQAMNLFGITINKLQSQNLLVQIAGPQRRITKQSFINVLTGEVHRMRPDLAQPAQQRPLPPPDEMRRQLVIYYAGACADGIVDSQEIVTALKMFDVIIDINQARQLLVEIAGPQRRVNQDSFIAVLMNYIQRVRPSPYPPQQPPPGQYQQYPPPTQYGQQPLQQSHTQQPPYQPYGQPQPPTPAYGQAPYNPSSPSAYNPALSQSGYAQNASYQTPPPPQTLPTPGQPSPQPNTLQQSIYGQTPIPSAPPSAPPAEDFPQHPQQGYAPPCATNPPPPAPPPSYGAPPQQLPSPYGSGGHTQDPPPSSVAPYSQPPAPMGGPLPPHIESQLNSFYVHATQTGNFNTQQTVEACRLFGVSCDNDTAIRLLTEVAGAERRVTQARFVEVVGRYIASRV
ncbi:hypothetical protein BLNAU_2107 [Blattamonas nauphoetae]|uniref:EF-hand domain-containing protein n=1 Tax=Blattamonas nauphoetae TaxID=2049346 RepID=A0ABQ9YH46_9EUKA|nr:hypothetical protein BLNAU_2107 [Blattamonas nauphoetae]